MDNKDPFLNQPTATNPTDPTQLPSNDSPETGALSNDDQMREELDQLLSEAAGDGDGAPDGENSQELEDDQEDEDGENSGEPTASAA